MISLQIRKQTVSDINLLCKNFKISQILFLLKCIQWNKKSLDAFSIQLGPSIISQRWSLICIVL